MQGTLFEWDTFKSFDVLLFAWYFATALAKQYEAALPYLQSHCLEQWTHNKAIQKALESTRIPPEHKEILRTLKRKQEKE